MQQPAPTAGRGLPRFGGALTLSVAAHGLALAGWFWVHQAMQASPGIGQKRGGLSVTLVTSPSTELDTSKHVLQTTGQPLRPTAVSTHSVMALTAPLRSIGASLPPHAAVDAVASRPSAISASEPQAVPTPAMPLQQSQPPGAQFASLFAPIVSRPLGRGRWSFAPPQPPPMPPPAQMAAMQREQAIQGIRQSLAQRIERIRGQLRSAPLAQACDIAISLERQTGQVRCDHPQDGQWLSSQLGDLLNMLPMSAAMVGDQCLQAAASALSWVDCPPPQPDP